MENASKALIIAGAILLSILIIAIGIYIFQSASGTIENSMASMNTQEIEAWNSQFTSYVGEQSGTNVKALITRLIANGNTYTDEPGKVPSVNVGTMKDSKGSPISGLNSASYTSIDGNSLTTYAKNLSGISNKVVNKHVYTVEFEYDKSGLIVLVKITDKT